MQKTTWTIWETPEPDGGRTYVAALEPPNPAARPVARVQSRTADGAMVRHCWGQSDPC